MTKDTLQWRRRDVVKRDFFAKLRCNNEVATAHAKKADGEHGKDNINGALNTASQKATLGSG